jgi:uncharacterized protein YpuA (DUF1002 family)
MAETRTGNKVLYCTVHVDDDTDDDDNDVVQDTLVNYETKFSSRQKNGVIKFSTLLHNIRDLFKCRSRQNGRMSKHM